MAGRPVVFETPRMWAREWSLADVEASWDMYRREEVVRYIGGEIQEDLAAAKARLEFVIERNRGLPDGLGSFPLFRKTDDRLIGTAILKFLPGADHEPTDDVEIGWHLHPDVWGRGYATEAGRALIEQGFGPLGLLELHAVVEPANVRSQAVALRLGMTPQGRTRRYYGGVEVEHYRQRRP